MAHTPESGFSRLPDYILCGSINLHKSPEVAATLAKYIDKQWDFLRVNRNGIISSHQLEINRNPDAFGGKKDGKPLTVSEWEKQQKEKLLEKRKELADLESNPANRSSTSGAQRASSRAGRGRSRGRRGFSRGRGRNTANTGFNEAANAGHSSQVNESSSSGRASHGRRGRTPSSATRRARGQSRRRGRGGGISNRTSDTNAHTKRHPSRGSKPRTHRTLNVKLPRIAKRNLRDKGDLPRSRGPDKLPLQPPPDAESSPMAGQAHGVAGDDGRATPPVSLMMPQLDGNLSDLLSSSEESAAGDYVTSTASQLQSDTPLTGSPNPFQPAHSSTQSYNDDLMGQPGDAGRWNNPMPLGEWMRAMREGIPQLTPEPDVTVSSSPGSEPLAPQGLGESWVGPPLDEWASSQNTCPPVSQGTQNATNTSYSRQPTQVGNLSRAEVDAMSPPTQLAGEALNAWRKEQEDLFGVSPSAFLYALQEPCVFLQKVINISGATVIMDPKADRVRAAIICSTHLNVWPAPEFCSGDMVTCVLRTKKHGEIYVVSLYCDGEDPKPVPDMLRLLQARARRERKQLLVMGDFNAHSSAGWGSKSTDARGKAWEKFVFDKGLRILNKGDRFTFIAPTGQSIVDVCLATPQVADLVKHWATIDHVPSSDHVLNEFMLFSDDCWTTKPKRYVLCAKARDWAGFTEMMEAKVSPILGTKWTLQDQELECSSLIEAMHTCMQATGPVAGTTQRIFAIEWWTKEIDRLHSKVKKIRRYIRKWAYKRLNRDLPETPYNRMKYSFEELREARRAFKKACRRAKRKHWRQIVGEINSTVETARFSKRLNKENNAEIGLFTKADGQRCNTEETLDLLKDTHFPGNTTEKPPPTKPLSEEVDITSAEVDFITPDRLKACIASFKPGKGAGPDGLQPAVFQHLGPKALQRLANLYKASYLFGVQPEHFKMVRVIFIPKPGRPDYSVAKAHRPISLMNFIMKIMEKFLLWHHEDTILIKDPLEDEQHGFIKAKSCDSAITIIVSHAEYALSRGEYCVLALLDVEGAFDNATYRSMLEPLRQKGTPENFISWIQDFLQCRKSSISVKGINRTIYHTRGTPQGGCSSPYLWACVINELIKLVKPMDGLHIICYADDIALAAKGPDLLDCVSRLQRGVNAVEQWASAHSLKLSHSKSEVLLLTQKRKYHSLVMATPPLRVGDKPVHYAFGSVRYLGIWLDRKLSWSDHVRTKCNKVKKLLMKAITATGSWWGLKPYQGLYFWEALGRTVLSYGCLAWQHSTRKKSVEARLTSTQRLGFQLIAPFRKGTPNKGLELIFNCSPMKVHLARMATKSYFRTIQHAPYTSEQLDTSVESRISHRSWIKKLINDQGLSYLESPLDVVPLHRQWDRYFEVDWKSMSPQNPSRGTPDIRGVNIFTDGSKDGSRTGAGVVIMDGGQISTDSHGTEQTYQYHLGEHTTSFQCEMFALKMAATLIINGSYGTDDWVCRRPITIYTDSQASILALTSIWVKSLLVKQTRDLMDRAAKLCKSLTISWVKAHIGHDGNERADKAARLGRDDDVAPDWETPLLAKAVMHNEINKMATRLWEQDWDEVIECRQTRHWFPNGPRPKFVRELIYLPKLILGQIIQIITGHTYLKRHQAVIDESERQRIIEANDFDNADDDGNAIIDAPDPSCSRCGKGEESPFHILTECDSLATLRKDIFGREDLVPKGSPPDLTDISIHKLISFFLEAKFDTLTMRPNLEEYYPTKSDKSGNIEELLKDKESATQVGTLHLSEYLYHITNRWRSNTGARSKKNGPNPASQVTHSEDGHD